MLMIAITIRYINMYTRNYMHVRTHVSIRYIHMHVYTLDMHIYVIGPVKTDHVSTYTKIGFLT